MDANLCPRLNKDRTACPRAVPKARGHRAPLARRRSGLRPLALSALLLHTIGADSNLRALTVADLGPPHAVKLVVQHGYLPGIPMLVRVELRDASGPERELWNADATLSVDDPAVTLSTNRVLLRNGLGSALVAFRDGTDFNLSASVGTLQATRPLVSLAGAPVTEVGGTLAGANVWSGVVRVTNDVTVPSGASLTILSNTLVLMDGVTSGTIANDLLISGRIESLGDEEFPVAITCNSTNLAVRWGQIRHNSSEPSLYRHTSITRGGRAPSEGHTGTAPVVRPTSSTLRFESCSITDLAEPVRGAPGFGTPGKIAQATGSDLTFIDCVLQRARMGPEIAGTALLCSNTWIMDMGGPDDSDGFYVHDQSANQLVTFSGCVIADGDDDGIDTLGSTIAVENCIIRDWDNLFEDAKGISVFNGATTVRRSLIVDSTVGIAAKWSSGSATLVNIDHCTLTRNLTNVWANRKDNAPGPFIDYRITNCVMWGTPTSIQSDFGTTNFTIGYCNISQAWPGTGNLMAEPLFVEATAHDFHLQAYSPCIDSGNPASPLDPDGTRVDMGYLPFVLPAPMLSSPQQSGNGLGFLLSAYTNRSYVVEVSDTLTNWTALQTNFQSTPSTPLLDPTATNSARRFYRARSLNLAPQLR